MTKGLQEFYDLSGLLEDNDDLVIEYITHINPHANRYKVREMIEEGDFNRLSCYVNRCLDQNIKELKSWLMIEKGRAKFEF